MTTLLDIKKKMLDYMEYDPTDGYDCGPQLWNDIKRFWTNFDSDKKFIYVVSGEWCDDLDF